MLKIATVNLNGLRASIRKGFLNWLDNYDADIVCLQEIRVAEKDLPLKSLKSQNTNLLFLTLKNLDIVGLVFFTEKCLKQLIK